MEKVTIIGGGNGGFAAAADLTIRGNQVTLFELPQFADGLKEVIERGGIEMEAYETNGLKGGFAKLHKITTDIQEALAESDIVIMIAPSYSTANMAKVCAPYLRDNHIFCMMPGNFGGILYFANEVKKSGNNANVQYADFSCMIYATRKKTPSSSWVRGYKHNLGVAMFPSNGSEGAFARLKSIYPYIKQYNNVIETGMSNINTTLHTSLMLLNAANIDNQEDRLFYRECTTSPSLDNIMDALNEERVALNTLPNMAVPTLVQIIKDWYGYQGAVGETVVELQHSIPHFAYSPMPKTMNYRYVTEDVPFGLIPIAEFLGKMGFKNTMHTALVNIMCAVCKKDFYDGAMSLEKMGLDGMNIDQVMDYLATGKK